MPRAQLSLIEFPADDPERAQRFWEGLLEEPLDDRDEREGTGRQTRSAVPAVGVHARGRGPGRHRIAAVFRRWGHGGGAAACSGPRRQCGASWWNVVGMPRLRGHAVRPRRRAAARLTPFARIRDACAQARRHSSAVSPRP